MFVVYSLFLRYAVRYSPRQFFLRTREILLTGFSTSSSNATLPVTLRVAEQELCVPRQIGGFVLTVGSTANQNGTALYEGVTVLFLAQFFGVELSLGAQVSVVLLSILAGVGTAGVPGGSLPMVGALLVTVGRALGGVGDHPVRGPVAGHVPHRTQHHRRRGHRRLRHPLRRLPAARLTPPDDTAFTMGFGRVRGQTPLPA